MLQRATISAATLLRSVATLAVILTAACAAEIDTNGTGDTVEQSLSACTYPNWVQYQNYPAGSIVTYNGQLYRAKFANPGYIPTVSTYYWEPYTCTASSCTYPDWVQYQNYPAGSIVTYNGQLYEAKFANPGYIPTVSTYYWKPYTCAGSSTTPPPSGTSPTLPAKIVGGYFTTWDFRPGVTLGSVVDNTNYNLIYIAFATGVSAASGTLKLDFPQGVSSAADFQSQVAHANSKGKKVIISVGGWYDLGNTSSGYLLNSPTKVDQFMTSMREFRNTWGFNGMDWDLEHGERPDAAGIIDASRRMRTEFGASWIIAAAPGIDMPGWIGSGGILDQIGSSGWDIVGEQVYSGGRPAAEYNSLIINRMTSLSNKYGAAKVVLGNADPDPAENFVRFSTTRAALATLRGAGINIRGAFAWTIQADADAGYLWQGSNGVGGDILSNP